MKVMIRKIAISFILVSVYSLVGYGQDKKMHNYSDEELETISSYIKALEEADLEVPFVIDVERRSTVLSLLSVTSNIKEKDEYFYDFDDEGITKLVSYIDMLEQRNSTRTTTEYQLEIKTADGELKKYNFASLKAMNKFIKDLKRSDPVFAAQLKSGEELDIAIVSTNEGRKAYKFTSLESMQDMMLKMNNDELALKDKLKQNSLDLELIQPDGTKQKFTFQTLDAMNDFLVNLDKLNPKLSQELKSGDGFDVALISSDGQLRNYKFKTLAAMTKVTLNLKTEDKVFAESLIAQEDIEMEIINSNGKREKLKFPNLPAMNEYLLKLEETNPALAAQLKAGDGFEMDLVMPDGSIKAYDFKTLDAMTDVTLKMKPEEFALKSNQKVEHDYLMEIIMPDGKKEKFVFKSLPAMNEYMKNLSETNPELAAQLKSMADFDMRITIIEEKTNNSTYKFHDEEQLLAADTTKEDTEMIAKEDEKSTDEKEGVKESVGNTTKFYDNVSFELNKWSISPSHKTSLNKIVKEMLANKSIELTILGHTDNSGSASFNKNLANLRASAVRAYLVSKGIKVSRLLTKSYGAEKPVATNNSEQGRSKNRRVEIRLRKEGDKDEAFLSTPIEVKKKVEVQLKRKRLATA